MAVYSVSKKFQWNGKRTKNVVNAMRMFGMSVDAINDRAINYRCSANIEHGDIVLITGPSGCGKSVLLRELEVQMPKCDSINLTDIEISDHKAVIDCTADDFFKSYQFLSLAGLAESRCIINTPSQLSEGQKYRLKIAKAAASGKTFIFADEFCMNLDAITAAVVAHSIHQHAKREKKTFILAAGRTHFVEDLMPDIVIDLDFSGRGKTIYANMERHREWELAAY